MKSYRYVASSRDRRTVRGTVPADDAYTAAAMLRARGLLPIRVHETEHSTASAPLGDLAGFIRGVATLVKAGVPVGAALTAQERTPRLRVLAREVRRALHEGEGLSVALERLDAPPEVVGVVRAGERSDLDTALGAAADLLERRIAIARELAAALAYPGVLVVVGTAAIVALIVEVLPRFTGLLSDTGTSLPPATAALMSVSAFLRNGWMWIVLSVCAIGAVARLWFRTVRGQAVLLTFPVVGGIRFRLATARVARTLGVLLQHGSPALTAIAAAREATSDLAVAARLGAAANRIHDGQPMSGAFEECKVMTPEAIMLMRIGEDSGRVSELLERAAGIEEEHAMSGIRALTRMVEPALVVALGAVVGFVALAILQAMYGLRPGF